jgi:hypothetical protein
MLLSVFLLLCRPSLTHFVWLRLVSVVASEAESHPSTTRSCANRQTRNGKGTPPVFCPDPKRSGLRAPTYPREYRSLALLCIGGQATETAGVGRIQSQTRRVPTLPARLDDASRGRQLPTQVRHAEACRRSGQAGTRQFCVSFGCHSVKRV